ncbi:hypothetical protein NP233_g8753 [Leucocoprinus birnbaumii]|uniref:Uncharacterized protein n=1 Tax=Leucocoprinus birnbaumii TaxID=56174 RepID=A0AAD5YMU6_9AGAR|nr:hypothetical protein NP233_g8753 [Leucocoprinus birnbaumii]
MEGNNPNPAPSLHTTLLASQPAKPWSGTSTFSAYISTPGSRRENMKTAITHCVLPARLISTGARTPSPAVVRCSTRNQGRLSGTLLTFTQTAKSAGPTEIVYEQLGKATVSSLSQAPPATLL